MSSLHSELSVFVSSDTLLRIDHGLMDEHAYANTLREIMKFHSVPETRSQSEHSRSQILNIGLYFSQIYISGYVRTTWLRPHAGIGLGS
jgi:hypothetical protein